MQFVNLYYSYEKDSFTVWIIALKLDSRFQYHMFAGWCRMPYPPVELEKSFIPKYSCVN